MPIMLNTLLVDAGLSVKDVRLLRHKDNRASKGRTPYELWRDSRSEFERYQSSQTFGNRPKLRAAYWAVFIANLNNETMFAGVYAVRYRGILDRDEPMPHIAGETEKAGSIDIYDLKLVDILRDLIGCLFIDWGSGALAWIQYPERNNKQVTEVRREFREDEFPGFLKFVAPLSGIESLPGNWMAALKSAKGVYLLTCPKTREQYVGKADGENGFLGRWQEYVRTGHGGNVVLKTRDPSDYQVSILEVAGTRSTADDIGSMESMWKQKLRSREMGLNRN